MRWSTQLNIRNLCYDCVRCFRRFNILTLPFCHGEDICLNFGLPACFFFFFWDRTLWLCLFLSFSPTWRLSNETIWMVDLSCKMIEPFLCNFIFYWNWWYINCMSFSRDPEVLDISAHEVFPRLFKEKLSNS